MKLFMKIWVALAEYVCRMVVLYYITLTWIYHVIYKHIAHTSKNVQVSYTTKCTLVHNTHKYCQTKKNN